MAVAPPAARFPYLPISMPLAHGAGGRGSRPAHADAKSALGAGNVMTMVHHGVQGVGYGHAPLCSWACHTRTTVIKPQQ